ncbi:Iron-sulfur binding protein [Bacillus sp. ZZV12-4809]|nr:Iron-sulfur binding protein [Bacillus sp. ZZV12-4809]
MFKLRGHHLFCLLGYRGMGYSQEYAENMTRMHKTLRDNPRTWIQLVKGPDHLCEKYPNSGEYHCEHDNIYERDAVILEKLGLHIGQILYWQDIELNIRKHALPSDIQTVCETCSWRSYGVCEEGIRDILEGQGLREVK